MSHRTALTVAILAMFVASLAVTEVASAHNISIPAAGRKAKARYNSLIGNPATGFVDGQWGCVRSNPGHNHYASCNLNFDTAATRSTKNWACKESIAIYLLPAGADRGNTLFMRHQGASCFGPRLTGPRPG